MLTTYLPFPSIRRLNSAFEFIHIQMDSSQQSHPILDNAFSEVFTGSLLTFRTLIIHLVIIHSFCCLSQLRSPYVSANNIFFANLPRYSDYSLFWKHNNWNNIKFQTEFEPQFCAFLYSIHQLIIRLLQQMN